MSTFVDPDPKDEAAGPLDDELAEIESYEDPDVLLAFDPTVFDDDDSLADLTDEAFLPNRDFTEELWAGERFSSDLTDFIDWDSIDYE